MNISEQNLLAGINKNKPEAFNELFNLTYCGLCSYVDQFINDSCASEDIIQEIFIKFFEKKGHFKSYIAVKVYFYRSARNAAINHLKSVKKTDRLDFSCFEKLMCDNGFSSSVIEQEVINELRLIIKTLPSKCQKIIGFSMAGMKNIEIAEELDISINTVKTQKKIGYKIIKDSISDKVELLSIIAMLLLE